MKLYLPSTLDVRIPPDCQIHPEILKKIHHSLKGVLSHGILPHYLPLVKPAAVARTFLLFVTGKNEEASTRGP